MTPISDFTDVYSQDLPYTPPSQVSSEVYKTSALRKHVLDAAEGTGREPAQPAVANAGPSETQAVNATASSTASGVSLRHPPNVPQEAE